MKSPLAALRQENCSREIEAREIPSSQWAAHAALFISPQGPHLSQTSSAVLVVTGFTSLLLNKKAEELGMSRTTVATTLSKQILKRVYDAGKDDNRDDKNGQLACRATHREQAVSHLDLVL